MKKLFTYLLCTIFFSSLVMAQTNVPKYPNEVWNTKNVIKNWDFTTELAPWSGWADGNLAGQLPPVVQNGVCVMKPSNAPDGQGWHYSFNQSPLNLELSVPYTLYIKSWASGDSPCKLRFEDATAGDAVIGLSSDATAVNGTSEWKYNVNTTPGWYTFHVVFNKLVKETEAKIQWQLSFSNNTIYLDSVLLVKDKDLILSNRQLPVNSSMKVYPNPIGSENQLNVSLGAAGIEVSIYNALGQKIMEKVATGNIAEFDVSSLRKGMYVVKLSDGTSQKFLK